MCPWPKNDESIVTQFTMTTLEELGLLKMDFLGLRNLTVIADAERMIRTPGAGLFDMDSAPRWMTRRSMKCSPRAMPAGCSSWNRRGMRQVLIQLRPQSIEDLIAVISLYRPGPMDSIPQYIRKTAQPGAGHLQAPRCWSRSWT